MNQTIPDLLRENKIFSMIIQKQVIKKEMKLPMLQKF